MAVLFRIPRETTFLLSMVMFLIGGAIPIAEIAFAEEEAAQQTSVKLSIRTIQATEPREAANDESTPRLEPALGDLGAKLARLPFARFQLLAAKEETITIRKRNSVKLPNGQSLALRPISTENKKMGLWLNWKDSDGSEILNTRVHFDSNDSVLTGTDCAHDKGLILAIKAETIPAVGQ